MKVTIEKLYYKDYTLDVDYASYYPLYTIEAPTKPALLALHDRKGYVEIISETNEIANIEIICNGIIVRDDLITIEFPDGLIADYEIESDDYHRITII